MLSELKNKMKNNITEEIKIKLIKAGKTKIFQPNSFIFKENDTSDLIYIIIEGECEVLIKDKANSLKTIETLQEGDIFGEMGLFLGDKRSASVKTKTLVETAYFKDEEFLKAISKIPEFNFTVMNTLVERLNKSNKKIIELQNYKEINSVCIFLLDETGINENDEIKFNALDISFKLNIHIGQLIKVLFILENEKIISNLNIKDSFQPQLKVNREFLKNFLINNAYKKI
jgi:CRP-like cAMP-binding protein